MNALALKLTPEVHDKKMEELMLLVHQHGIKNALSVVEKLGDTHVEDDFHRFLVQYVKSGFPVEGVKPETPLAKSLTKTLYEVIIPESQDGQQKGLKEILSGMEQFYAGMLSVSAGDNPSEHSLILEIANSNGSEQSIFYVSVPDARKDLFEKQILSIFHDAVVTEKRDDHNIFNEGGVSLGSVAYSGGQAIFPFKTYESFDHDPLNIILNSFTKIKKDGEGACIQIIMTPATSKYFDLYTESLEKLRKGKTVSEAVAPEFSFQQEAKGIFSEIFGSKKKENKEPGPVDTAAVERVQKKIATPIVSVSVRVAASAHEESRAKAILHELQSSFNQFNDPQGNMFKWNDVKEGNLAEFFRNFAFRIPVREEAIPMNLTELTTLVHFHTSALQGASQLKTTKAGVAPAPMDIAVEGTLIGTNNFRGEAKNIYITDEDRLRHIYTIGQTGTGKTTLLKNMIIQDIQRGNGVCMIDPHGSDILDVLAHIPPERRDDVIYFDPAYTERPMGLNMLEYDRNRPEQKTFVVNELFSIFQKLYGGVPESMGPMFEQYFRNATMLVIEDPDSGSTLLDVSRVMVNKEFRNLKISKCKNPVVVQFWKEIAEKAGGEGALANIVPYITSKFDVFLANEVMRPIIAQEKSSFDFREIMDSKKILLVNLSKGRLGDINANLIGLIIVGKILMAALSRVDVLGKDFPAFYLYIDEFQNITTPSISTILSEARKYKLSLFVAHQFIAQLTDDIKNAVFGNVGNMIVYRVGSEDAEFLVKQFDPVFTASQIMNIDNYNAYVKLLTHGKPTKPFDIQAARPGPVSGINVNALQELSYLKYGSSRAEVESEILKKYEKVAPPASAGE